MKHEMKRKGFTLVELLIVIVVIGILSAMMMLSSTEAVTSARASNVVSNLRNLKTAALAFYVDHLDAMEGEKNVASTAKTTTTSKYNFTVNSKPATFFEAVASYMNASEANNMEDGYEVLIDSTGDWYVTYDIKGTAAEKKGIVEKLKGRAKSVGLCSGATKGTSYADAGDGTPKVGMYVR